MTDHDALANRKLRDLISATQNGLAAAEGYVNQANALVAKCKSSCERLELAYTKLDLITNELNKQLNLIGQVIAQLKRRNTDLIQHIEKLQYTHEEVDAGLVEIFNKLKDKQVDPNLVSNNSANSMAEGGTKTLYDYVDTMAVDTLKEQTTRELTEMKNLQYAGERTILELDEKYNDLFSLSKGHTFRQDTIRPSYGADKMALQRNEANSMSALLLDMVTHHDRMLNISQGGVHYDVVALEARTEGLSTQLSRLHDSLLRIGTNTSEVEARLPRTTAAYKGVTGVLNNLDTFGEDLKAQLDAFQEIEESSKMHNANVQFLQEELNNLVTWYGLFYTAYHELLHEIDRRHKTQKRHQEIVDSYSRELKLMWQSETQKRGNFFEYHGRYLPPSLCPAIMEQATRYQIFPEQFETNLPVLSISLTPTSTTLSTTLSSTPLEYSFEQLRVVGADISAHPSPSSHSHTNL